MESQQLREFIDSIEHGVELARTIPRFHPPPAAWEAEYSLSEGDDSATWPC
jgi:hypothetical protein